MKNVQKIVSQCIKTAISGLLIFWIVRQIGMHELLSLMAELNPYWMGAALLLFTASHFMGSYQWFVLLRHQQVMIPWKTTAGFYFVGLFFNNFLISQLGGDLFRVADIHRYARDNAAAVTTVFLDRLAGLFVMSSLAIFSAPWILFSNQLGHQLNLIYAAILTGWGLIILLLFNHRFTRPAARLIRPILPQKIASIIKDIYWKIHQFGRQPALLLRVLMISLMVQGCRIFTHYLIARALGVTVPVIYFFLFIPIIAIMASLPISLGGLGVREQAGVLLFAAVGMADKQAVSMEFLAYIVAIVTSLPGGLVFVLRKKVAACPAADELKQCEESI